MVWHVFFSSPSRDINSTLENSKKGEDRRLGRQQGYNIYFPFFRSFKSHIWSCASPLSLRLHARQRDQQEEHQGRS